MNKAPPGGLGLHRDLEWGGDFWTVRRLNKYARWNCMRKYVVWKESIEIEIREEIVAVTGFCGNLFSIWVVLEDRVSFDVEIQVSETREEP